MKKNSALCALTALSLTVCLTACGGRETTQTPAPQSSAPAAPSAAPAQSQAPAAPDSYVFLSGDFAISIDQDMAEVLAALGEPQSYFEAASCAFEGLDKIYTYPGFQITTRPDGDKDYVNSILLTDDSVTTPEGVYIGSPREDVLELYQASADGSDGSLMLTIGNTTLSFIFQDGKVLSIEYLPA